MAVKIKELVKQPELLTGGHRACAGCTAPTAIRQALMVSGPDTVVGFATGCMGAHFGDVNYLSDFEFDQLKKASDNQLSLAYFLF